VPEQKLVDECVHCGFCLPACPTYHNWNEEMDSPRGRIYLMRGLNDGSSKMDETVVKHFDRCLGCMACVTACPSGVKYDALIEDTRAEVEAGYQRSLGDRLFRGMIFALFPYPARLKALLFLQFLYVRSGLRWLFHKIGLLRLLPQRLAQLENLMPAVSAHQLRAHLPDFSPAEGPRRARVALLTGCVQRVYFPEVNEATLRVLNAEGCDVVLPAGQGCCGALSLHSGREHEAKHLAQELIQLFERQEVDRILVNAAGCGSNLKEYGRLFRNDPQWAQRGAAIAAKVRDITEFLAELPPVARRHPLPARVAYHDACHLAHAQRIREQPRALLRGIPELILCEIEAGDQCCGSAGVYNLVEPASAHEIGLRKVENVLASMPDLLASANPGCTLQIQSILRERGATLRAAHPIEILDASLRGASAESLGKPV
jgi:glycolate oxidase iron-sulfur subunit